MFIGKQEREEGSKNIVAKYKGQEMRGSRLSKILDRQRRLKDKMIGRHTDGYYEAMLYDIKSPRLKTIDRCVWGMRLLNSPDAWPIRVQYKPSTMHNSDNEIIDTLDVDLFTSNLTNKLAPNKALGFYLPLETLILCGADDNGRLDTEGIYSLLGVCVWASLITDPNDLYEVVRGLCEPNFLLKFTNGRTRKGDSFMTEQILTAKDIENLNKKSLPAWEVGFVDPVNFECYEKVKKYFMFKSGTKYPKDRTDQVLMPYKYGGPISWAMGWDDPFEIGLYLHQKSGAEVAESLALIVAKLGTDALVLTNFATDKDFEPFWEDTAGNAGYMISIFLEWAMQHPEGLFVIGNQI